LFTNFGGSLNYFQIIHHTKTHTVCVYATIVEGILGGQNMSALIHYFQTIHNATTHIPYLTNAMLETEYLSPYPRRCIYS
jgi:hypothetical protein